MTTTGLIDDNLMLPGVITEIIPDYTQDYDTSEFGSTDSVTILGTAFDGVVGKAFPIYSPEHAKYILGDSFDPVTRREATLTAEIYDAWDRGCRTIYAVRISGKEIYKDYDLATETNLKLRVSGIFPSNKNKDVFLNYVTTQSESAGAGVFKVYKLPERSTMQEKINGMVVNDNEMLVSTVSLEGYGITKDSRLVDALSILNSNESNNVLRVSIVDENGIDVTISKEAQALSLGVVFPGVYTIARDKVASGVVAKTEFKYVLSTTAKPHANFQEDLWKELVVNSDVSANLPIFSVSSYELNSLLPVIVDDEGEYLKPIGTIDKIAVKNTIDYEEVELDPFDTYKRLGSGFAQTAQVKEIKATDGSTKGYKVVVPNTNDINRVQSISDGIYSVLENYSTDYVVLTSVHADTEISGVLPRKEEFKKRKAVSTIVKENDADVLELASIIDEKDFKKAKPTKVVINAVDVPINREEIIAALNTEMVLQTVGAVEEAEVATVELKEGELLMVGESLKKVVSGSLTDYNLEGKFLIRKGDTLTAKIIDTNGGMLEDLVIEEGSTFIANAGETANVLMKTATEIVPVATLIQLTDRALDDDYTLSYVEDLNTGVHIIVNSTEVQWMTYSELANRLNEDAVFSKYFKANALTPDAETGVTMSGAAVDKGDIYFDTTMYIPYTTSDNFARHLAQHCTYASIKTYPTHGVIACTKIKGVSLGSVAQKVESILALDLDLYAKKGNGNNMLNNKNMPYPIGKAISIPFMQYSVTTGNGYTYTSSGAAGYSGLLSIIAPGESTTNHAISLNNLSFELSNYQLNRLTGKGIVTVKSTNLGMFITDGITAAPSDSVYRRLSTIKVINATDNIIRDAATPFIGKQNSLSNRNSLNTALTSALNAINGTLIEKYSYKILNGDTSNLGHIDINYAIVPFNEIREVRNSINISETV